MSSNKAKNRLRRQRLQRTSVLANEYTLPALTESTFQRIVRKLRKRGGPSWLLSFLDANAVEVD